jgi:hypothetical protein
MPREVAAEIGELIRRKRPHAGFFNYIQEYTDGIMSESNTAVARPLPLWPYSASDNVIYHALNLRAEKRLGAGLNFLVNYTWSKSLESGSGGNSAMQQNGGTTNPLDSWNLRKEKAVSALDLPSVFVVSAGYELPFGKGKPWQAETPSPAPCWASGN